jgi:hypothetical protein
MTTKEKYLELKEAYHEARRNFFNEEDGFVYAFFLKMKNDILVPDQPTVYTNAINNAEAWHEWYWSYRSSVQPTLLLTNNTSFHFDSISDFNQVGYSSGEEIKIVKGFMLDILLGDATYKGYDSSKIDFAVRGNNIVILTPEHTDFILKFN